MGNIAHGVVYVTDDAFKRDASVVSHPVRFLLISPRVNIIQCVTVRDAPRPAGCLYLLCGCFPSPRV
jgi:hypothetical protein